MTNFSEFIERRSGKINQLMNSLAIIADVNNNIVKTFNVNKLIREKNNLNNGMLNDSSVRNQSDN